MRLRVMAAGVRGRPTVHAYTRAAHTVMAAAAVFVLTPQAALGDQRPVDQLRAGAVSAVVRVAQRTGTVVGETAAVPSMPACSPGTSPEQCSAEQMRR